MRTAVLLQPRRRLGPVGRQRGLLAIAALRRQRPLLCVRRHVAQGMGWEVTRTAAQITGHVRETSLIVTGAAGSEAVSRGCRRLRLRLRLLRKRLSAAPRRRAVGSSALLLGRLWQPNGRSLRARLLLRARRKCYLGLLVLWLLLVDGLGEAGGRVGRLR